MSNEPRWIRPDGTEQTFSEKQMLIAAIRRGEVGSNDLVRLSSEDIWIRASELASQSQPTVLGEDYAQGLDRDQQSEWMCGQCGSDVSEDATECWSCGADVTVIEETALSRPPEATAGGWERSNAPWRRYFARVLDFAVAAMVMGVAVAIFFPSLLVNSSDRFIGLVGVWVVFPFLDALFLTFWQTSPGKWLLGVRTVVEEGRIFTFGEALGRAASLVIRGIWFGIPLLSIIPLIVAYGRATKGREQPWETTSGTHTEVRPLGPGVILFVGLLIVVFALAGQA